MEKAEKEFDVIDEWFKYIHKTGCVKATITTQDDFYIALTKSCNFHKIYINISQSNIDFENCFLIQYEMNQGGI